MILLKTILNEWFQFIYLQKRVNLFSQFHLYSIFKNIITKFQFGHKNYFYLLLLENNDFLQFYLHNISICFHLRKMTYTNY